VEVAYQEKLANGLMKSLPDFIKNMVHVSGKKVL